MKILSRSKDRAALIVAVRAVLLDELLERLAPDLADRLAFTAGSRSRALVKVYRGAKVQPRRMTAATRE